MTATLGADPSSARRAKLAGALIVAAGLGARLLVADLPVTDVRATQSAMIMRNMAADGLSGLLWPRVDYAGPDPGYLLLESPLVSALGAALARWVGPDAEWPLRSPSIVSSVILAWALFDLALRRLGPTAAVAAVALLGVFPLHAGASGSPAPDEASVALATASLALCDRASTSGRRRTYVLCGLLACAALLAKATVFPALLPAAVLGARPASSRRLARLALAIAAASTPTILWLAHAVAVNATSELWPGITALEAMGSYALQRGRLTHYASGGWYLQTAERALQAVTLPGSLVGACGLLAMLARRAERALAIGWMAGMALYCGAFPLHVATHSYYMTPLLPFAAYAGAALIAWLAGRRERLVGALGPPVALAVAVAAGTPRTVASLAAFDAEKVQLGSAIRGVVPEGGLVIVVAPWIGPWDGSLLYQARRRGWTFASAGPASEDDPPPPAQSAGSRAASRVLSAAGLERLRASGASFLVYVGAPSRWRREQPRLTEHVLCRYATVSDSERLLVIDLRRVRDPATCAADGAGGR